VGEDRVNHSCRSNSSLESIVLVLARRAELDVVVLGAEPQPALAPAGSIHGTVDRSEWSDGRGSQAEACRRRSIRTRDGFGKRWAVRVCQRPLPDVFRSRSRRRFCVADVIGTLHAGESYTIPNTALAVAESFTDVEVGLSQIDVAEEQIKIERAARAGRAAKLLCHLHPNAVPLTSKQKFKLAWKTVIDPFTLVAVAGAAGVEQAQDHFAEYGQGAQGYAKRFGAGYADYGVWRVHWCRLTAIASEAGSSVFLQGTGSTRSRALYAIANSFVCKGDNGRWQTNYSNILGSLAAAASRISIIPGRIGMGWD